MITRREIDRLAIPAIISGIVEPIIALVDTAFVGQLGAAPLAGVGIASSFFLLLVWMLSQTKSAVTAAVAHHYGQASIDKVQGLVPLAIWLNIGLGVAILFITRIFDSGIFELYAAKGGVLEQALIYYRIRVFGFPVVLGTMVIFGAFRGIQNTSWPMWTSLTGGVMNLILDPILIFGIVDIIEPMGVAGAAWASLFAQCVMFIMAFIILLRKTSFRFIPKHLYHPQIGSLLSLSGNLFIRTLAMNIAYYFGNRQATLLGDVHIAAHTIAMNIWLFSAYFIDGYAEAAMVLSGRLKGERNWPELYRVGIKSTWICIQIGSIIAVIYAALYVWVGPFFSSDPLVQRSFAAVFWILIISQPINAIAFAMDGIFNGLGDGALMRNVLVLSTLFCFVPMILLATVMDWGLAGIWFTFLLWMIARGLPLLFTFRRRYVGLETDVH